MNANFPALLSKECGQNVVGSLLGLMKRSLQDEKQRSSRVFQGRGIIGRRHGRGADWSALENSRSFRPRLRVRPQQLGRALAPVVHSVNRCFLNERMRGCVNE